MGPLISVIIPTFRRVPLVKRAVQSVLRQTYTAIEVIVVIDGTDDGTRAVIDGLNDPRTVVIETGCNRGPAEARNVGIRQATGHYAALLDDDDEWLPEKLERQMMLVRHHGLENQDFLATCRVELRLTTGGSTTQPTELYRASADLGEYLLDRGSPFRQVGMIATGTVLFPRSLALRVPFVNDDMHEDWSWLLLSVVRERTPVVMCEDALSVYYVDPNTASLSKRPNWRGSLAWGRRYRTLMSARAFAGLLATTTIWRAKRQHDWRGFFEIAQAMRREGSATLMHWLMFYGVVAMPIEYAEKIRLKVKLWK
jgi:glycosyltransferase involved in cell wall biosynthesis